MYIYPVDILTFLANCGSSDSPERKPYTDKKAYRACDIEQTGFRADPGYSEELWETPRISRPRRDRVEGPESFLTSG